MASLATYTFLCSESITCADVYKAHLHVSLLDVVGEPGGGIYSCHDLSEVIKMTVKWSTFLKVSKCISGDILSDFITRWQNAKAMLVIFILL